MNPEGGSIFLTRKSPSPKIFPTQNRGFRFEKIFVDEFFSVWTHEAIAEADKRGGNGKGALMKRALEP